MRNTDNLKRNNEIFTFHLVNMSFFSMLKHLISPLHKKNITGLKHSESFFLMNLGEPILFLKRFNLKSIGLFMWWSDENELNQFLRQETNKVFSENGWHIQMKKYRKWGSIREIDSAQISTHIKEPDGPVVAVTLARLKLSQTLRFTKWGKPVEAQVKSHSGKNLAYAAFRPFNTFCTFSIWKNEKEMQDMVNGRVPFKDGRDHKMAMVERTKKPFHFEFSTMRFVPLKEAGMWKGGSNFTKASRY